MMVDVNFGCINFNNFYSIFSLAKLLVDNIISSDRDTIYFFSSKYVSETGKGEKKGRKWRG